MANICPQCGAPAQNGATTCQYCGAAIPAEAPAAAAQGAAQQNAAPSQPVIIVQSAPQQQAQPQTVYVQEDPRKSWPIKNKIVAGILALLLGGIGVHKFYLGQIGMGVLCILFCWTGIPALIAFIEGIIILCSNTENFELKYRVRAER